MPSSLLSRALPLFVFLLVVVFPSTSLTAAQSYPSYDYPGPTYVNRVEGCPTFVDYYPTYPSALTGNCTAGQLVYIHGTNMSSSVDATLVLLVGEHTHNVTVLATNATTITAQLPANPEPDNGLGWDEANSFTLHVVVEGYVMWRVPPRNLGVWYDRVAASVRKAQDGPEHSTIE